jgi:hypothetical protein
MKSTPCLFQILTVKLGLKYVVVLHVLKKHYSNHQKMSHLDAVQKFRFHNPSFCSGLQFILYKCYSFYVNTSIWVKKLET